MAQEGEEMIWDGILRHIIRNETKRLQATIDADRQTKNELYAEILELRKMVEVCKYHHANYSSMIANYEVTQKQILELRSTNLDKDDLICDLEAKNVNMIAEYSTLADRLYFWIKEHDELMKKRL